MIIKPSSIAGIKLRWILLIFTLETLAGAQTALLSEEINLALAVAGTNFIRGLKLIPALKELLLMMAVEP